MKVTENEKLQVIKFLSALADRKRIEIESIQSLLDMINQKNTLIDNPLGYSGTFPENAVNGETNDSTKRKLPLVSVKVFNLKSKLDQKIAYALTKIGRGFKEDILHEINLAQPDSDPHKLEKAVAVRLSYLIKHHLIEVKKIARRYEYWLIGDDSIGKK